MPKTIHPPWSQAVVHAVCEVLASTDWPGQTNREIDLLLQGQSIELLGVEQTRPADGAAYGPAAGRPGSELRDPVHL
jgi:hypothetical protein